MDRTYLPGKNFLKHFTALVVCIFLISSCQKEEMENGGTQENMAYFSELESDGTSIMYFEPETFTIVSKDPLDETRLLTNDNYRYFDNFILTVQNGNSGKTKVSKMEILIDGVVVVTYADFRKNTNIVSKALTGITESSNIEIRLEGSKGRFVKLYIKCSLQNDVISDVEGNYYHTIQIGEDRWMSENLKTTVYNDGTPLTYLTDGALWDDMSSSEEGYYCFYNDDEANKETYGGLYSLRAVAPMWYEDNLNICPEGWHVSSFNDFWDMIQLLDPSVIYFDEILNAGAKLKEAGTTHWQSPNTGATNESGFTALPGGIRYETSGYMGLHGSWWLGYGEGFALNYNNTNMYHWWDSYDGGHSVRCVKNRAESRSEIVKLFKYPERSHSGKVEIK